MLSDARDLTVLHTAQLDDWLERLIEEKGEDLYRMKGVLSVSGSDERYVFQVLIFFHHLQLNFHSLT